MRARGEGRLFKRGKVWWIQFYSHGRQVRESAKTQSEREAGRFLRRRLKEVEDGIAQEVRGLRYEDIRDAYLNNLVLDAKKSLRHDADGKPFIEAVRRLDAFFADYRTVEIGPDQIRKFKLKEKARGLANGTINRSVACLRRMFTMAQQEEKLSHIPFFRMLPEAKPRKGTLPQEQYSLLLAQLPDYLRPVVTIGFRTGMRLGEILNLKWQNVLWMDRIIRLDAGTTKNDEAREIPFGADLEKTLRERYAKRQEGCDRVCFRFNRKGRAIPIGNFRKPWWRACCQLGLGSLQPVTDEKGQPVFYPRRYLHSKPKQKVRYTGLIFHDLRRSFVTDAEHAGAPRHEVMAITGHKTESVYKRYAIGDREQCRAALDHIEAYRAERLRGQFGDNSQSSEQDASVIN
jgi:integrase